MQCYPSRKPAFFVSLAVGLAALLILSLVWSLSAAAARPPAEGVTRAEGEVPSEASNPAAASAAGVITWTFDYDNMDWTTRDVYDLEYEPASWADGAIYERFSNWTSSSFEPENFAGFRSPRLDPPLRGNRGSLSFNHVQTAGELTAVLFSACLRSSSSPLPRGHLPCTEWRPQFNEQVSFDLVADGTWNDFDFFNMPLWPPYTPSPLTHKQLMTILKEVRGVSIYYTSVDDLCVFPKSDCLRFATITLDDVRLEVSGLSGTLNASSPYIMDGDPALFFATVKDEDGAVVRGSHEITMTLGADPFAWTLYDEDTPFRSDLYAGDGVHSTWVYIGGDGPLEAKLYYQGEELASTTITVTQHPHLVALTDIQALYDTFLAYDTPPDYDEDKDGMPDFYQLLIDLRDYAEKHKGIVYDVRWSIDTETGFPDDYRVLIFDGPDPATNRFRQAQLIDEALTRLHRLSQHTIANIAIIGGDQIIPYYRLRNPFPDDPPFFWPGNNPTLLDLMAGYMMSDVPYGTVDYVNQEAVALPVIQIPTGRVVATLSPLQLSFLLKKLQRDMPIVGEVGPAALFVQADTADSDGIWAHRADLWSKKLLGHLDLRDFRNAPPYRDGFYRYLGDLVRWGPDDVLTALESNVAVTIIASNGNHELNTTMLDNLNVRDYGFPYGPARLYVNTGPAGGLAPALSWEFNMPTAVQDSGITYLGSTSSIAGCMEDACYTDYLFTKFVNELFWSETVGEALARASWWHSFQRGWDPNLAKRTAYSIILYGLPTKQTIHHMPEEKAAVVALAEDAGMLASGTAAVTRSFIATVDVPNFQLETDEEGTVLVRPGPGGSLWAGGEGQPLLPSVAQRFALPVGATAVTVTEDTAARQTQDAGKLTLRAARSYVNGVAPPPTTGRAAAAPAALYPTQTFTYTVGATGTSPELGLLAIPARVEADGTLMLFTHMEFNVSYSLPAAPAASITNLSVNNGQAVRAGAASVPLKINVTTGAARPVTVTYSLTDPSGYTSGGGQATANLPKGTSQVQLTMTATRWTAGPKVLTVAVADETGTLDAASTNVQVLGLLLEADVANASVSPGEKVNLTVRAWDENGAAAGGLASKLTVQVDGAAWAVTFTEGPAGRYTAALDTAGLTIGGHEVTVAATDNRGLAAKAWTAFTIARFTYLPLILR